jgi:hypothetical protein
MDEKQLSLIEHDAMQVDNQPVCDLVDEFRKLVVRIAELEERLSEHEGISMQEWANSFPKCENKEN